MFGIRRVLERHAIESAFPLSTADGTDPLVEVRAQLEEMGRADGDGDELRKDDAHRAFHAAVVTLAQNRQLDLALEPILLKLQRPMALNLRREALLLGRGVGMGRHERLLAALETNDKDVILAGLEAHGSRRFLLASSG